MGLFIKKIMKWVSRGVASCLILAIPFEGISAPLPVFPASVSAINVSQPYQPVLFKGMTVDPNNPFAFNFIIDPAQTGLEGKALEEETSKLVRYFIASLAVPEDKMWVNLSAYEKDRIIPDVFGRTEMGRDLLAQDYVLKRLTASLLNPQGDVGRRFWDKVYAKVYAEFGTVDIPVDTFNKVWIIPDIAKVYQHQNNVFIVESRLKVMLEEDYLASQLSGDRTSSIKDGRPMASDVKGVLLEMIIPIIEQEINEGENFAALRQVYNAMLLAVWYKKTLKESVLSHVFVNQENISGLDSIQPNKIQEIYGQYLQAFQSGAGGILEEYDPASTQIVAKKYFSGGAEAYREQLVSGTDLSGEDLKDLIPKSTCFSSYILLYNESNVRDLFILSLVIFFIYLGYKGFNKYIKGNKAMLSKAEEVASRNPDIAPGGMDFKSAASQLEVSGDSQMVFPRWADFSRKQFSIETISPQMTPLKSVSAAQWDQLLGLK